MCKKKIKKKTNFVYNYRESTQINELLEKTNQLYVEFERSNFKDSRIRKEINIHKKEFKGLRV